MIPIDKSGMRVWQKYLNDKYQTKIQEIDQMPADQTAAIQGTQLSIISILYVLTYWMLICVSSVLQDIDRSIISPSCLVKLSIPFAF